jgi:gliding motility-associated transport system permease protein
MTKAPILARRELAAYFYSPIAYVVACGFLLLSGYFFYVELVRGQQATLRFALQNMTIVMIFVVPFVTMRLLAEEWKSGTIEPLMTDPVSDWDVVFGKFLAAIGFYAFLLLPTLAYVVILKYVGEPEMGPILTTYLGILLMGCLYVSIGLFASSLTSSQIVAAIVSFAILLMLLVVGWAAEGKGGAILDWLTYLGTNKHLDSFRKGIIDSKDVVYYLSTTVLFLFFTVRIVESRKWK